MLLTKLRLQAFKHVQDVEIDLSRTTVLVGTNNSGKSSVLQGIHFSISAAVAQRGASGQTFSQDSLLYCPTGSFLSLRHGGGYRNQDNFSFLHLFAMVDGIEQEHTIRIYRGRNEGNLGCERSGAPRLSQVVSDPDSLFSIYVPGLAGIPQYEQLRSEGVIRRGVAGGDANMLLRNVLLLIHEGNRQAELQLLMRKVFPRFEATVHFNKRVDTNIAVSVSSPSSRQASNVVSNSW